MEDILIIKASIPDINILKIIAEKTYTETFGPYNTEENLQAYLTRAFSIQTLTKELMEPNSQWYFALAKNELTGYIKLNFGKAQTELQDSKAMEVERIYVLQKFQGKNIGKLLMDKAIAIAEEHKVQYIWLGVWEQNKKALEFYKRKGFVTFSQHSFFVGDDEQIDWMMKLSLQESTEQYYQNE